MVEIRIATPEDAAAILAFCKLAGAETDNLSFGAEGVSFTVEQEQEFFNFMVLMEVEIAEELIVLS